MGRYIYRAWVTNLPLTPAGIWHFYDGRAAMEIRIRELREDFALRKVPTASFAANALYLEIVRLAYNLVTAFQRTCLEDSWQSLTLQRLRYIAWKTGKKERYLYLSTYGRSPSRAVLPQNRGGYYSRDCVTEYASCFTTGVNGQSSLLERKPSV
jgi:hypothetical protein